jgi:hypothetical protein
LVSFGLTQEDVAVTVEIWPENYQAFSVFNALSTQWRYSMSGVTGLDYNAIPTVLRMMKVARDEWQWLFEDIRFMESIALTEINRKE